MSSTKLLTAIIEKEGDGYVALCPEVDVASQGVTVEQARSNLKEALEVFFEVLHFVQEKKRSERGPLTKFMRAVMRMHH